MGVLLMVTGAIWAIIGFTNITLLPWGESSDQALAFGIIFNMILFILPGFIVYGVGVGVRKKKAASTAPGIEEAVEPIKQSNVEERLNQLNELKKKSFINESEYESRRTEILNEL
jgi:hypothetical protein